MHILYILDLNKAPGQCDYQQAVVRFVKKLQQLLSPIYNIPSTSGKVLLTIASDVVNSFGKSVLE